MKQLKNKNTVRSWQKKKKKKKISLKLDLRRSKNTSKNKKRKPINKRAVASFIGGLAVIALFYFALYADNLRIKTIGVSGNENVAVNKMESIVRDEISAKKFGFIPGDNCLLVDREEIKNKLMENFSEIESIDVNVNFPNEIILKVQEKNTALIWCRDQCYFVNDQGVAFLLADEGELIKEQKHFIKIIEEAQIAEETETERQSMQKEVGEDADNVEKNMMEGENYGSNVEDIETAVQKGFSVLPAITLNEKVSDVSFVSFAVEISGLVGRNQRLKIKYFKTKGYRTRELIGFTDKNTKLYFDTTKSAEKQAKNLDYLLNEAIDKEKIDTLQYIYLKNEDRVFYK
ncbi:MAG: FtsQ-type POTRA domain-containing protein [Candidatus Pacebacteria bacterium]|nr:FtsQ-type POTRA domain-containing protein [Candidatus Paceibacterota bacterium]